jgi:hypothetical protein
MPQGPDFGHAWCNHIPGQGIPDTPPKARPKPYEGPFDPPPAESMEGAIAWRFVKEHNHDNTRWYPTGWEIIKSDGILTVDYNTKLAIRDSIIYAP